MAAKIANLKISDILVPKKKGKGKIVDSSPGHDKAGALSSAAGGAEGQKGVKPKSVPKQKTKRR